MHCLKVVTVTVFAFIVMFNKAQGCELNEAMGQKIAIECATRHSDPAFLIAVASHMENPDVMARASFVCHYPKDIVNIVMCVKDKLQECIPQEYKKFMAMFPSKERLSDGLKFMCDNKDIVADRCFDDSINNVFQCYMGKVNQLKEGTQSMTDLSVDEVKGLLCSVVRSEEQCFRTYRGSCSEKTIETVIGIIEKVFPSSSCPASAKNELTNSILGSILVHGAPQGNNLKFQPYVIKN